VRNTSGLKRGGSPGRPKGSKNRLTIERVEEELRRIATMDPGDLFSVPRGGRRYTLRAIQDMSPEARACIASIDVVARNLSDRRPGEIVRIRFWNKVKALELCARALGMLKDHIAVAGLDERKARLREALAPVSEGLISRLDRAKECARLAASQAGAE
jgi:hypothetical protein